MRKPAETNHTIHELLQERWSPRAFSSQPVEPEKLLSLFEAARWSPSGGNQQPWAFIVATKDDMQAHQKLVQTMMGRNPLWANTAPVLVLSLAKSSPQHPMNRFAYYDVGQAIAHLSVQAAALGLHVHQMAGFDAQKARELFEIPAEYEPMTLTAIGYFGNLDELPDDLRQREVAPRSRKPLSEIFFKGRWNEPFTADIAAPAVEPA